eukprot:Pompholyxophrys_punicea_v1_NODE_242_length_2578_cov_11.424891.p4 type:complete len:101 gc:universal NODE_242_length_2578_cov_11.424891:1479-1781(+)
MKKTSRFILLPYFDTFIHVHARTISHVAEGAFFKNFHLFHVLFSVLNCSLVLIHVAGKEITKTSLRSWPSMKTPFLCFLTVNPSRCSHRRAVSAEIFLRS